jgi:hypothetical protein
VHSQPYFLIVIWLRSSSKFINDYLSILRVHLFQGRVLYILSSLFQSDLLNACRLVFRV